MKTSKIFIGAKNRLPRDRLYGICYAISAVTFINTIDERKACEIISQRLGLYTMAPHWLAAQVTKSNNWDVRQAWIARQEPRAIQAWRHAWLDQLIAEFKAKGD